MGRFNGRDDALHPACVFKSSYGLFIRDRHILCPVDLIQVRVLRPDPGVIQPGGNRIDRGDLPIFVLAEQALHPVEYANPSRADGCCRLKGIDPAACCLTADQLHLRVLDKMIERADRIGASAYTRKHAVRQPSFPLKDLRPCFPGDHRLEIPHDGGKWVRPHDGAEAIMRVRDPVRPLPECLRDSILQGCRAAGDRNHVSSQKLHFINIQRLALSVNLPHEDDTFHSEIRRSGRSRDAMLSRSGLRDQARFSHFPGKEGLPKHIVDLMGTGKIQILPLEINLCASQVFRHFSRKIQGAWTICVFIEKSRQLRLERRILFVMRVCLIQLDHGIHERLRNVLTPESSKPALFSCICFHDSLLLTIAVTIHPPIAQNAKCASLNRFQLCL